jgi:hypothetical protein
MKALVRALSVVAKATRQLAVFPVFDGAGSETLSG